MVPIPIPRLRITIQTTMVATITRTTVEALITIPDKAAGDTIPRAIRLREAGKVAMLEVVRARERHRKSKPESLFALIRFGGCYRLA